MKPFQWTFLCVFAAAVSVLLSWVLRLNVWAVQEWQQMEAIARNDEELDRRQERQVGRHEVKNGVIKELIAGRLTLKEAVARFRAVNEEDPDAVEAVCKGQPAATVDESVCRQVLSWTEARLDPAT